MTQQGGNSAVPFPPRHLDKRGKVRTARLLYLSAPEDKLLNQEGKGNSSTAVKVHTSLPVATALSECTI